VSTPAPEIARPTAPPPRPSRPAHFARVHSETLVPRPLDETFAFFSNAHNLDRLTPPWVGFRILTPAPIRMGVGTLIDYQIRIRAIPIRWRTEIIVWEPPHRFVDVQLKGPYRWWHHEHRFEAAPGGTRVIDDVEYRAPLAWLSHPLMVSRDVRRIFDYRTRALAAVFGPAAPDIKAS
jgi:ligand-binding SRPBCC domain-containing protein